MPHPALSCQPKKGRELREMLNTTFDIPNVIFLELETLEKSILIIQFQFYNNKILRRRSSSKTAQYKPEKEHPSW